jgi:Aminoglycoside/hydroxyurea antibiotic resistance kinase
VSSRLAATMPHCVRHGSNACPMCCETWSADGLLTLDAPFDDDEVSCSYLATVTHADGTPADGTPAVLKIGMPHMEGEHEIQGLRFWAGDPTVRLLTADDDLGRKV